MSATAGLSFSNRLVITDTGAITAKVCNKPIASTDKESLAYCLHKGETVASIARQVFPNADARVLKAQFKAFAAAIDVPFSWPGKEGDVVFIPLLAWIR